MAAPRIVPGELLPAWSGPLLLAVGTASWLAAAVSVGGEQPEASQTQTRTVSEPLAVEEPVEVERSKEAPRTPVAAPPVAAPSPVAVQDEPAKPAAAPVPCAPEVEFIFEPGSVAPQSADALDSVVNIAAKFETRQLIVEGYASAHGGSRTNLELSHRRAKRVERMLVARNIKQDRIVVQAFGEYRPRAGSQQGQDRRAVVRVEGIPTCTNEGREQ